MEIFLDFLEYFRYVNNLISRLILDAVGNDAEAT